MATPIFALADCNNFYVSGERGFRPSLVGRLVVVLSNNDGCIIARSEEAKALSFAMGDPYHLHHEHLTRHGVHVFSPNYALYGDMSRRVMDTLADYTPEIELYSIDEAFLNLAGFDRRGLTEYAPLIQAMVRRHTGIPVSIGIGPTKTLAKVANHVAETEPDAGGVYDLAAAGEVDRVLASVEVGEVWGVGRRWAAWLAGQWIITALDLIPGPPALGATEAGRARFYALVPCILGIHVGLPLIVLGIRGELFSPNNGLEGASRYWLGLAEIGVGLGLLYGALTRLVSGVLAGTWIVGMGLIGLEPMLENLHYLGFAAFFFPTGRTVRDRPLARSRPRTAACPRAPCHE
jgi:hypothetical protein